MNKEFTYKGKWFLPNSTNDFIFGLLSYSPFKGGELDLYGKFKIKFDNEIPIIWGILANGKYVTLYKSFYLSTTFSTGEGFSESKIFSNYILIGAWFEDANDIKFYKANVFYNHLDNWLNLKGFSHSRNENYREVNVNYTLPNDILLFSDRKEKIWIKNSYKVPGKNQHLEISIQQYSFFQFVWRRGHKLSEISNEFYQLQHFLTLFIQNAIMITGIVGYIKTKDKTSLHEIQIFFKLTKPNKFKEEIDLMRMLIPYGVIEKEIQVYFLKWRENSGRLTTTINNFFSVFNSPFFYSSDKYLTIVRSLEAYHREFIKKDTNFKNRILEILTIYSKMYNHILNIKSKSQYAEKVKKLRNDLTHANPYDEKKEEYSYLSHILSEQLSLVMTCVLLDFIGIPREVIKIQLDSSIIFSYLKKWKSK